MPLTALIYYQQISTECTAIILLKMTQCKATRGMMTVRWNWPSCHSWWLHDVCASPCHNPAVQLSTHNEFCSRVDDTNCQVMTAVPALCQISVNTTTVLHFSNYLHGIKQKKDIYAIIE